MTSRDGYVWTKSEGIRAGVPTIGKIEPSTNLKSDSSRIFDVIVVGAGYSGLTAARDATLAGTYADVAKAILTCDRTESPHP